MLNESQTQTLEELQMLRRQVELLESHRVVFKGENTLNITPKQIAQAEYRILRSLEEKERAEGIEVVDNSINGKLKRIDQMITEIKKDLAEFKRYLTEEDYNLEIQLAIDEIMENAEAHNGNPTEDKAD